MYYLDNAATTKVLYEISSVVNNYNEHDFFNPSSVYLPAVRVKKDIDAIRDLILDKLSASDHKVLFLSSATEANNIIFESVNLRPGDKILISSVEHPAVYNKALSLKEKGILVETIGCKNSGELDIDDLKSKLDKSVKLVSVMAVCNETGVIHDLKSISRVIKSFNKNILFAVDGVQAFGKIDLCIDDLDIDFFVLSGHKIHAPKGIGALVYRKNLHISPMLIGGGQENGLRSGTENVSGIMALGKATEIAFKNRKNNIEKVLFYKTKLIDALKLNIPGVVVNGDGVNVSPYILSVSIDNIRGEVLLHMLEKYEIYISTGSACSSKHFDNRILNAMGRSMNQVMGSIRISFNAYDELDIDFVCEKLINEIRDLQGKMN